MVRYKISKLILEFGLRLPIFFFLDPRYITVKIIQFNPYRYWLSLKSSKLNEIEWLAEQLRLSDSKTDAEVIPDVEADEELAKSDAPHAIKIVNLSKTYSTLSGRITKIAVNKLCTYFEQGRVCAVLGQNGAGKSTTMNMLSGLTPPTSGDARILGLSIRKEMPQIRQLMGIW